MSFSPTWPSDTKDIIDDIRTAIGRSITINVGVEQDPCPVCSLDPETNTSKDSFCTTCSGVYWITTTSGLSVLAHVNWKKTDQPFYTAGGKIAEGDCIVTIEYTATNLSAVENSVGFIVDTKDLYMKNYELRGVQDINRIRVLLKEDNE